MSKYAADHADALADVRDAGADVTCTRAVNTYDPTTGTMTIGTPTTITGAAIEVDGDRDTYRALTLTHVSGLSLFFVPDTLGDMPRAGDTLVWGGATVTVRAASKPIAIDGEVIAVTLVCARG